MRIARRLLDQSLLVVLLGSLALIQTPHIRTDGGSIPRVDALDRVIDVLAASALDTARTTPGSVNDDGTTLPARAGAGIRTSLAGGRDVAIGLPAKGPGTQVGHGSVAYDGEAARTRLVVDRVDADVMPEIASSTRTQIAIDQKTAPTRYEFSLDLPSGATLSGQASGAVYALDANGKVIGFFAAPWALDAFGEPVPTRFEVAGSTLVQVVNHRRASYPVVADPWWFVPLIVAGRVVTHKVAVRAATRAAARQAAIELARRQGHSVRSVGRPIKGNFFTAANHIIRVNGTFTRRNGFSSFRAFKNRYGTRDGYDWHHIVEQRNVGRFKAWKIHNKQNLIQIRNGLHRACVSALMSTRLKNMTRAELRSLNITRVPANRNLTLRQALDGYSLANMHLVGLRLLSFCGVRLSGVP